MSKSCKERAADLAERKKAEGLVKVSHSRWVPASMADKVREAMRKAVDKAVMKKNNRPQKKPAP